MMILGKVSQTLELGWSNAGADLGDFRWKHPGKTVYSEPARNDIAKDKGQTTA